MLVQLSFPSKSGKSNQKAVYEFSDCRSLETAIATLKATNARKANKPTTTFEVIESHNGPIYRWDSNTNKFINEHQQNAHNHVEVKKAKIDEFFDTIEEFIVLHKPMVTCANCSL